MNSEIYVYLFGVQVLAWGLKLASHPTNAASSMEVVERARLGAIQGPVVVALVGVLLLVGIGLALLKGGGSQERRG